ncbi:drug/metabolite transporter (DMT)-like permease [Bradyrhizobium diazoefficiens]
MPPNDNRIDARDWSLLAVLSILWGGSFFFNSAGLRELPPLTLVFLRVALGAAVLLPLLHVQGISFPKGTLGWKPFFVIGLLNNVIPFSLIVIGRPSFPAGWPPS